MGDDKKAVWLLEKRNLVAGKTFKSFVLLNKKGADTINYLITLTLMKL